MNQMSKQVGMSRNITLEYLNKVIELMNTEDTQSLIKESLQEHISCYIQDKTNISKTVNILANIWLSDKDDNRSIKKYARKIVTNSSETTKLVANWCMMLISYSVFKDIASTVGKLNNMQLELSSKVIKEKMLDSWGERTTLIHAIPKNIKTMKDLNVLETIKTGVYKSKKYEVKDREAVILIVATLIHLKKKLYLSIDELTNDEAMFPFKYNIDLEMLQESKLFFFDRFGGEMVISLKG